MPCEIALSIAQNSSSKDQQALAQKLALSQAVGDALKSELEDTVVTVEVIDIDRATYFKG